MTASRPPSQERITLELTDALFRQSTTAIVGVTLALAGFVAFEWSRQPHELLLPWVALQGLALVIRWFVTRAYTRRHRQGPLDPRRWLRLFTLALAFSGLLWGAAGVMFLDARDPIGTAFLMIYDGGLIATVMIILSLHLPAFLAFTLLAVTPMVIHSLSSGSSLLRYTGAAALLYLILCIVAARRLHAVFRRSAELRFQNEDLAISLRHQKEQVEAALLAKSKFLAAASHDLRQPLHALSIFVELLDQRLRDGEERAFLEKIQSSSRALDGLLNALLDVSRMDAQTLQKRPAHFPLQRLFDQLDVEFGPLAHHQGLTLSVKTVDLVVESDPELLGRVLRNLLSNAIRYTQRGEITLAAFEQESAGDSAVRITVTDTGPGIPLEEQQKVFEEFYQIGNPERDREKGLGLGLSIVRGLCQILDHPLQLISMPDLAVGTQFVICVPAGSRELAHKRDTAGTMPQWAVSPLEGRTVLVIDDERDVRQGMQALLKSWRCEAIVVASVSEALARFAAEPSGPNGRQRPDLVICDYRLPDHMSGLQAIPLLEERFGCRLPTVIVTGDTSPEEIRKIKRAGYHLLFKPVNPGKLRAVLTAMVTPEGEDV